jgi:hypothetical protein
MASGWALFLNGLVDCSHIHARHPFSYSEKAPVRWVLPQVSVMRRGIKGLFWGEGVITEYI